MDLADHTMEMEEFTHIPAKTWNSGDTSKRMNDCQSCQLDLDIGVSFQIFNKTLDDKLTSIRVRAEDLVQDLKENVKDKLGIPMKLQSMIYVEKYLQDVLRLQEYDIKQNSYIILNMRLQGGFPRTSFSKVLVLF